MVAGEDASAKAHTDHVEPEPGSLAVYFNSWYADMAGSPTMDAIQQRHLGLPPRLL
jgi:hypothetical protein